MGTALTTWLNIVGLGLDFAGAAFLAYDVLYGAHARMQASARRAQHALLRGAQHEEERSQQRSQAGSGARSAASLRNELRLGGKVVDEAVEELGQWEQHQLRAQVYALVGLGLLMVGFACQALSSILVSLAA